jgi:hypothetical protein
MRLPVVSDQLVRCGLSPEDRHIAAYQVIECAIYNSIGDPTHQTLLLMTLAYPQERGSFNCQPPLAASEPPSFLGVRQQRVMSLYGWSKDETLLRRQADAYADLADILVGASVSPCTQKLEQDASHQAEILALTALLSILSPKHRDLVKELLLGGLFTKYPGLGRAAAQLEGHHESDVARVILHSAHYRKFLRSIRKSSQLRPPYLSSGALLDRALFERRLAGKGIDPAIHYWYLGRHELSRAVEKEGRVRLDASSVGSLLGTSLELLNQFMTNTEVDKDWAKVFPRNRGSARVGGLDRTESQDHPGLGPVEGPGVPSRKRRKRSARGSS